MRGAIGFRAKTGRAIAVVLSGDGKTPRFVWRGEVSLIPDDMSLDTGPYHYVMELPWAEAQKAVKKYTTPIERVANEVVRQLAKEMRARDVGIEGVGVIGSRSRPLDRIGNEHIRAHAAEGILFRRVLEDAAAKQNLRCVAFTEEEVKEWGSASAKSALKQFGKEAGPPWRTDERLAATAAWIALS